MERVLLVIVDFKKRDDWSAEDNAAELEELVTSCGGTVMDKVICRCPQPTASHLITKGKVEEISLRTGQGDIDTVIFSHDLKGSQQRNLEHAFQRKTIDRTQLILDIFARHAQSQEGKMQVELAQLEYLLPRLVGHGIEMSRLGGGIGTVGPGETKLEMDRRRISERIIRLKRDLKELSHARHLKRKKRKDLDIPTISLVGYTNAGKSTLLNTLTDAQQTTADGLFTTLDPLSRKYILPNHQKIVFSDTVGFMHDLPHHLIEAFKATLEEVVESDLLLHVVDISEPRHRQLFDAVMEVLKDLGAHEKPIITVFNKIDQLEDRSWLREIADGFIDSVCISAITKENLHLLIAKIMDKTSLNMKKIHVKIPLTRMDLVNAIHREGRVISIEYTSECVQIEATVPLALSQKLAEFL